MNLLVTGASGFIGRSLISRFVERGTYRITAAIRDKDVAVPRGVNVVKIGDLGDFEDPHSRGSVVLDGIETIIHTAARVHVRERGDDNELAEFRRINVGGTLRLAALAAEAGVGRFIYISSVKACGEVTDGFEPFNEDWPARPVDPYGISKWEAEQGLRKISAETGMEHVIIRPPLVYGPGVKGNFLRLLRLVKHGIPLPFLHIENKRSLVGIENLVDFIHLSTYHADAANEVFLVSDDQDLSSAELVRRLASSMDKQARLFRVPVVPTRVLLRMLGREGLWLRLFGSLQVSCAKARRILGWAPPVTVDAGLMKVAHWYIGRQHVRD